MNIVSPQRHAFAIVVVVALALLSQSQLVASLTDGTLVLTEQATCGIIKSLRPRSNCRGTKGRITLEVDGSRRCLGAGASGWGGIALGLVVIAQLGVLHWGHVPALLWFCLGIVAATLMWLIHLAKVVLFTLGNSAGSFPVDPRLESFVGVVGYAAGLWAIFWIFRASARGSRIAKTA